MLLVYDLCRHGHGGLLNLLYLIGGNADERRPRSQ